MKGLQFGRLAKYQSLLALALMIACLSAATDSFLTMSNFWNILRQISVNLCLSIGMTLVVLTGGIDLSVGAVLALTGMVSALLVKQGLNLPWSGARSMLSVPPAVLGGIGVGALAGCLNGLTITRLKIPPFVATLGMLSIARGLTLLASGGYPMTGLGSGFTRLGTGSWHDIPAPVLIVASLSLVATVVMQRSAFGRHIYALGGSARAARLTGLRVTTITLAVYSICGALSGIAGVLVTARLDSAQPNAGVGYELDSIAAVVIGGTSLSGGRGSIAGTILGCLIIGVLNNGLFLLNVSPFWQQIIKGLVILVAVSLDRRKATHN